MICYECYARQGMSRLVQCIIPDQSHPFVLFSSKKRRTQHLIKNCTLTQLCRLFLAWFLFDPNNDLFLENYRPYYFVQISILLIKRQVSEQGLRKLSMSPTRTLFIQSKANPILICCLFLYSSIVFP